MSGNDAYVAYQGRLAGQPCIPDTSLGGFSVIDLTTHQIVGNIDDSSLPSAYSNGLYHATTVQISGHYAFTNAFYGSALTVIDISNPTSPQVVARVKQLELHLSR